MPEYTLYKCSANDSINKFCSTFFPQGITGNRRDMLQKKVDELKAALVKAIEDLTSMPDESENRMFTEQMLSGFFDKHPACRIVFDDNLILRSMDQSVRFHTRRVNDECINEDVIYATLPVYGFYLTFKQDGQIIGRSDSMKELGLYGGVLERTRDRNYGHPNASIGSRSASFENICTGNNRYTNEFRDLCSSGQFYDGRELLRILGKAAIWLESANLDDMYGTKMSPDYVIPASELDVEFADKLLGHLRHAVMSEDMVANFKEFLDSYSSLRLAEQIVCIMSMSTRTRIQKHAAAFFIAWAQWLLLHFDDIIHSLGLAKECMRTALKADLARVMHSVNCIISVFFSETYGAELERVLRTTLRCPAQLYEYGCHRRGRNWCPALEPYDGKDMFEELKRAYSVNEDSERDGPVPVPNNYASLAS